MLIIFFRIGKFVFGLNVVVTVLSVLLSLEPLPTLFLAKYHKLKASGKGLVGGIEVVLAVVLVYCGSVYNSYFQFPDTVIGSLYSAAEKTLLDLSGNRCQINYADGYAKQDDSYVFETVDTDSGVVLESGMLLDREESITLYTTTYDREKGEEYRSGTLTLEQMSAVTLERIVASNLAGNYFVGDKVDKGDTKVVAYYSDHSEKALEEGLQCQV